MRLRDARVLAAPTVLLPAFARAKALANRATHQSGEGGSKWRVSIRWLSMPC
jgi:hypothetical protein